MITHIAHVAMVARSGFAARCSCTWSGRTRRTLKAAYLDLDNHELDHPIRSHVNTTKLSEGAAQ